MSQQWSYASDQMSEVLITPFEEVGKQFGVARERIRQLQNQALANSRPKPCHFEYLTTRVRQSVMPAACYPDRYTA